MFVPMGIVLVFSGPPHLTTTQIINIHILATTRLLGMGMDPLHIAPLHNSLVLLFLGHILHLVTVWLTICPM